MNPTDVLLAHGVGAAQGTAGKAQVLNGYTFSSTALVGASGTMPNNGALNYTPGTANQSVPLGYTSGGTVQGDANLVAGNILRGVSIFGVAGTAPRQASGTVTSASTGTTVPTYQLGGSTTTNSNMYQVVVSGLSFQPTMVVLLNPANNEVVVFTQKRGLSTQVTANTSDSVEENITPQSVLHASSSWQSNGFTTYGFYSNTTYYWYAYE